MMHTKLIAAVATSLILAACGGTEPVAVPVVALAAVTAPAAVSPAPVASARANTFFADIPAASATAPAAAAQTPLPAAAEQVQAARLLAWEQSYSLEMHRQHEEQLARASQASAPEDN